MSHGEDFEDRRDETERISPWPLILAAVLAGGALLSLLFGILQVMREGPHPQQAQLPMPAAPAPGPEPAADLDIRFEAPDVAESVGDERTERAEIGRVFDALISGAGDRTAHFDVSRMLDAAVSAGMRAPRQDEPRMRQVMEGALDRNLQRSVPMMPVLQPGASYALRKLEFLEQPGEALVLVRHRLADGEGALTRWWFRKSGGKWKIYDFHSLDGNLRVSTMLAALMTTTEEVGYPAEERRAMKSFNTALQALQRRDLDLADRELRSEAMAALPEFLAGGRWQCLARIHMHREQYEQALECLRNAETAQPDAPIVERLRAVCCNALDRHEEALASARQFLSVVGDDADAYLEAGTALAALDRPAEAVAAFRQGLQENPQSGDNLAGLAEVIPADEAGELCDHLARLKEPDGWFYVLVATLSARRMNDAREMLAERYRSLRPPDEGAGR